jgi:hypothetical protein
LNVFHHIYSKEYGKEMKVRKEVQEYPNKPLKEAFMDKLKDDNDDKNFLLEFNNNSYCQRIFNSLICW